MVVFLGSVKFQHNYIFDDRSDYTFDHNQTSTFVDETIKAKHAGETDLRKYGKEVWYCHAENCTYAVTQFRKDIEDSK